MKVLILISLFLKIEGVVFDRESRKPVINALVFNQMKSIKIFTDINGFFSHKEFSKNDTLIFSHIGYRPETLIVRKDFIRVFMEKSFIELPAFEVRAPPVEKKFQTTGTYYSKKGVEIELIGWENPLKGISSYPGVIQGHIRGGRLDEALYTLDGAPIIDNMKREVAFEIPVWAISEMELYTSDFEPEFGDVTSGLVNLSTKKMNLKSELRLISRSDYIMFDKGYKETRSGVFLSRKTGFFSLRGIISGTRFWRTWEKVYGYPFEKSIDLLGDKTFMFGKHILILQDISHYREWREYEHLWNKYPEGLPPRRRESHRLGILYSYNFKPGWIFDLSFFDYILNYQIPGKGTREYDIIYEFDTLGFVTKGDKPIWTDRFQNRLFLKAKTQYIRKTHEFYFGTENSFYDLYLKEVRLYSDYIEGYHFYSFITYYNHYHYRPYQNALFLSWKIRSGETLLHAGIRYDRFDPRAWRPKVEIPLEYPPPEWIYEIKDSIKAKPKDQVSPRIGLSVRMYDAIFRVNFGRYFKIPQFEYLYSNPFYNIQTGYLPLYGNPDLKSSRTDIYEISWTYIINRNQNLNINFFYRESNNLVDALRAMPDTASLTDLSTGFTIYGDVGTATVHGIEFSWEGSYPSLRWVLSYTLMNAVGTFGTWLEEPSELEGVYIEPGETYPLSWDQRHTIAFELTLGKPDKSFISLHGKWGSGLPYSPKGGKPNSKRLPPNLESKLRIGTRWKKMLISFTVDNIINRKNILWVDGNGNPGGRLNDPLAYSEGRRIWLEISLYF